MKQVKEKLCKKFCLFLALVMMLSVCATGCSKQPGDVTDSTGSNSGASKNYTVSLKTAGGMALSGIDVYVYADSTLGDLVNFGQTDADGIVTFQIPEKDGYAIALSGVPAGYDVKSSYSFSGGTAIITLQSSLITTGDITTANMGLGSVMYDFELTNINGEKVNLAKLLGEKKMVMLNFWYTGCTWCWTEFPVMADAYEQYKDDIEIVAIDPMENDSVDSMKSALSNHDLDLPFQVAKCPYAWASAFNVSGYPTTVIIDRYGLICMMESGAITSKGAWINIFEHFTSDDYDQKLVNEAKDLVVQTKPTYTMEEESLVAGVLNNGEMNIHYYASNGEYAWPFLIGQKDGENCVYASNQNIDSSYAIICADVELKAGQALGFDYFASTELNTDILHVIVDDEDIYRISGQSTGWTSVYPCVADHDGTYKVVLSYVKDDSTDDGDDTIYIKNMRVVDAASIDTPTYIPKEAANTEDGFTFSYVDIVYNDADGYYHVGSKNGPLLLANLSAGTTQFNETDTAYMLAYNRGEIKVDGVDYFETLQTYAGYATNATINGYCTVTKELKTALEALAKVEGFDANDPNEWLKMCRYYAAYGTNGAQLDDPIKGLDNFCAYKATLGKNVSSNYFYYDRMIYPRGLRAGFTPSKSGVYRITSQSNSVQGVDGWIFDENGETVLVYEPDERMYDDDEVSMVMYMEAGKTYYLSIAYWDMYEEGYIYYDIEYVAQTLNFFRLASPAYFTYDSENLNYTIAGGIDVVLGSDGIWYEDLGKDANGNQKYGGKLYVDFTGSNGLFDRPIMSYEGVSGMIDLGGFDFTRTENDEYVLAILRAQGGDVDATYAYLKETWGEDYATYAANYQVDDVLSGRYHGTGEDLTEAIRKYTSKVDNSSNVERNGCVVATKDLTDILQQLMYKYTFEGVENSWTKLCYYYDYLGPEA